MKLISAISLSLISNVETPNTNRFHDRKLGDSIIMRHVSPFDPQQMQPRYGSNEIVKADKKWPSSSVFHCKAMPTINADHSNAGPHIWRQFHSARHETWDRI